MPAVATFDGYVRADGSVGTRNFLAVTIVGNCAASAARMVSDHFTPARLAAWPNVDGVVPLIHELGCGMEMTGEFMDVLRRTLGGCIRNPNNAGTVVLALGCERNNIYGFLEQENLARGATVHTVVLQEAGGTAAAVRQGIEAIESMLPLANQFERQPVSASHLCVGLLSASLDAQCGVSANPALGAAMDLIVEQGGSVILSDTPDLVALSDELAPHAATDQVAQALRGRVEGWRAYQAGRDTRSNRIALSDANGFVSVRDKASAGLARGGHSAIQAVYDYGQAITKPGLVFMDGPSDEAVSASGQMAAGANMLCLTTGKGSGFGTALVPTIKLASNSQVFAHFNDDLDVDCGGVLEGRLSVEDMGRCIFDAVLRYASGHKTCNEILNVGNTEFAPWPKGVLA
nr:UxaA family hydrolase [Pantoea sp. Ap-967]